MSEDLLGQGLLEQRVCWLEQSVVKAFEFISFENEATFSKERFVVSGVGASEAHARFLVSLINRFTDSSAYFAPYTTFVGDDPSTGQCDSILVVFSQGISNNSQIVLEKRSRFKQTVLFTSTTEDALSESGSEKRLQLFSSLVAEEASIVRFPENDEGTILLRVIGPMLGFFAGAHWVREMLGGSVPELAESSLNEALEQVASLSEEDLDLLAENFLEGFDMTFTNPTVEYAQNLAYKCVEGAFSFQPIIRDGFQYAHGPFQQNAKNAKGQWIFTCANDAEALLTDHIADLVEKTESELLVIESPIAEPWAFVYYELALNRVLLRAIQVSGIDQKQWPGKGEDGEVYLLDTFI